jgi:hypothetical protein
VRIPFLNSENRSVCAKCKHHEELEVCEFGEVEVFGGVTEHHCLATAHAMIDTITGEKDWSGVAYCWRRNMFGRCKYFMEKDNAQAG